jgi:uncharacterized protein YeaC (DUF1315 family)
MKKITTEMEQRIRDAFERNYEVLRLESGHALTQDAKDKALQQVLAYYRKLQDIAEKVTETEVRLTLPDQISSGNNKFNIEGVVDIVQDGEDVWMYDLKTHEREFIEGHREFYDKQLSIYSHIYEKIRGNKLDHTGVISTAMPAGLKEAMESRDESKIEEELRKWDPLIEIKCDRKKVDSTIKDFAEVVDKIESNCFETPSVDKLKEQIPGTKRAFASWVCQNCDARFSCEAYRQYAALNKRGYKARKYFVDYADPDDQEEFISGNVSAELPAAAEPEIPT